MMKTSYKTLPAFLWHFAKKYRWYLLGICFVALFWAVQLSLGSYLIKLIIDYASKDDLSVAYPAAGYVLLTFFISLVFRFYDYLDLKVFPNLKADIVLTLFDELQNHSYRYFQNQFAGSLSNKISDMAKGAEKIIDDIIHLIFGRGLAITVAAFTMFLVHPVFAIIFLTWEVVFVTGSIYFSRRTEPYSEHYSESRSYAMGQVVDSIANMLAIKSFARREYENRRLHHHFEDTVYKDQSLHWFMLKVKFFQGMSITLLMSAMIGFLIHLHQRGEISVGDFALILWLTTDIFNDTYYVAQEFVNFSEEVGTCKQALSILSTPPEVVDKEGAFPLAIREGKITFDHVSFSYRQGQEIFRDNSVTIHPGQKIGLVGFSGSGKTTFAHLILRFFDVDEGRILIDGQNIRDVTQESLRDQIAFIPQDPFLFHRTLMENIRYGQLTATNEEVIESAKKAECHAFIMDLKDGYSSLVGERGIKLSGGQRQRIAIARAILKNAPILILDEATSSLDSITENAIQKSMVHLFKGRTTLVIAHRLSTLHHMDRILVFKEGKIVEDGSHTELYAKKGHYRELWDKQVEGFLVE